jgi:hypothetical protein
MATVSRLITISIISFLLFFGQLGRLNLGQISLPLIDIFLPIIALYSFFKKNTSPKNIYFLVFSLIALISNIIHPFSFISFAYLCRLLALLILFTFPLSLTNLENKILDISIFSSLIFGLIQYLFWPNFTYFSSLNWDPHLYRLVGTYFDPTFTGLIFLFFLLTAFFKKNNLLTFISYLALALTYSRTALLCFFITFSFISIKTKNKKIFFISLFTLLLTIIILPRMPGEGTKLERDSSIKAKIENYSQGLTMFKNNFLVGVGYNNLPNIRPNKLSHSNSGFDGSLLTIAVTTGIFGLLFILLAFGKEFQSGSLLYQSLLLSLFIHSLFSNSLFYPWVTLYLLLLKNRK